MGVGGQRHVPAALPPAKRSGTHPLSPGPVWLCAPTGFDPLTVQPLASRYTDCTVPVHGFSYLIAKAGSS
jgi:hypothetical protein